MSYAVEVSDHIMVAHSLKGEVFGPAQRVHGATFVVKVAMMRDALDRNAIVVDIGIATQVLRRVLDIVAYRNLDEIAEFKGILTTTEFMCRWVFDQFAAEFAAGTFGADGAGVNRIRVTLVETPNASAWYEGTISA